MSDRYEILRTVRETDDARALEATDLRTGKRVFVKRFAARTVDPAALDREIARYQTIGARLQLPLLRDRQVVEGDPIVVLDWIDGLGISAPRSLDPATLLRLLAWLRALEAEVPDVFGRLTPSNLFILPGGAPRASVVLIGDHRRRAGAATESLGPWLAGALGFAERRDIDRFRTLLLAEVERLKQKAPGLGAEGVQDLTTPDEWYDYHLGRGENLLAGGRAAEAEDAFRAAQAIFDRPAAFVGRLKCRIRLGDRPGARALAERADAYRPRAGAELPVWLARERLLAGDPAGAIACALPALDAAGPAGERLLAVLVQAAAASGDERRRLEWLSDLARARPADDRILADLARGCRAAGTPAPFERAIADIGRPVLDPDVVAYRAELHAARGEVGAAAALLADYAAAGPRPTPAAVEAIDRILPGALDGGRRRLLALKALATRFPDDAFVRLTHVRALVVGGFSGEAVEVADRFPDDAALARLAVEALVYAGRHVQAIERAEVLLRRAPEDETLLALRLRSEEALGRSEDAAATRERLRRVARDPRVRAWVDGAAAAPSPPPPLPPGGRGVGVRGAPPPAEAAPLAVASSAPTIRVEAPLGAIRRLRPGDTIAIGRQPGPEGLVIDDPSVSRSAAEIRYDPDGRFAWIVPIGNSEMRLDGVPIEGKAGVSPGRAFTLTLGGATLRASPEG